MNLQYKVELGPFVAEARLDDSGIFMQRGPMREELRWEQVYGAALLRRPSETSNESLPKEIEAHAALFGGPDVIAKMRAMQNDFQGVVLGYRNERGHKRTFDFYYPVNDPRYLQEIVARVGSGWHGEVADRHQAEKKLGSAPGFFKTILFLIVLLLAVALLGVFGLFTALGPAFNFLSIQRMLLDLQDGEYTSFGSRFLTYVVLFVLAYLIRRWWRARLAQSRVKRATSSLFHH